MVRDWKCKISRDKLDLLGRVRPTTWAKYAAASTTIKTLRDTEPKRLYYHLRNTSYRENRSERLKFYYASVLKQGRQAIGNRLSGIFSEITSKLTLNESNCTIKLTLKKSFGFNTKSSISPPDAKPAFGRYKRRPPLRPITMPNELTMYHPTNFVVQGKLN